MITSYVPTTEEFIKWYSTAGIDDLERMVADAEDMIDSFSAELIRERNKLLAIKAILVNRK